jgi:hypothetical protein
VLRRGYLAIGLMPLDKLKYQVEHRACSLNRCNRFWMNKEIRELSSLSIRKTKLFFSIQNGE